MFIKFMLFGILLFAIYRLMGGKLPALRRDKDDHVPKGEDIKKIQEDTLVECQKCGTYVTYKESIIIKKTIYCSKACASGESDG